MIIFGVIVLLAPVITILIICRRKQHPPERHTIMPDESINTVTDGNGANAFGNALDHPDSRYYAVNDFYNMKSEGSLHILPRFQTYQQTTEYTCGSAAALMVLNYYNEFYYLALTTEWQTYASCVPAPGIEQYAGSNEEELQRNLENLMKRS